MSETHDGTGAGDHDQAYRFGSPLAYLSPWERARCTILRGQVKDKHAAALVARPSGLVVPVNDFWLDAPDTDER